MVAFTTIAYIIVALVALALVSSLPSAKGPDPKALTLSEFGIPQIKENQSKRVLMGTKWVTDPLIADYGHYRRRAIYKEP